MGSRPKTKDRATTQEFTSCHHRRLISYHINYLFSRLTSVVAVIESRGANRRAFSLPRTASKPKLPPDLQHARLTEVLDRMGHDLESLDTRRAEIINFIGALSTARTDPKALDMLDYIVNGDALSGRGLPEPELVKKNRKMSAEARAKISAAARKRWAKAKRVSGVKPNGHAGRALNARNPGWSDKDDEVIIKSLRATSEPQDAPEFARSLLKRLPHRTEGAVRQRITRLAKEGVIKQHLNGKGVHGGVPHMVLEAA